MEKHAIKAYESAEKELNNEKIVKLKEVIKRILERIDEIDKAIKGLEEEKKILKMDIDDFKTGRLDRIEERQEKDEKAKKASVVKIEQIEKHIHYHYDWYVPYQVTWVQPIIPSAPYFPTPVQCGCSTGVESDNGFCCTASNQPFTLTSSLSKDYTSGTYVVNDKTIHLR